MSIRAKATAAWRRRGRADMVNANVTAVYSHLGSGLIRIVLLAEDDPRSRAMPPRFELGLTADDAFTLAEQLNRLATTARLCGATGPVVKIQDVK